MKRRELRQGDVIRSVTTGTMLVALGPIPDPSVTSFRTMYRMDNPNRRVLLAHDQFTLTGRNYRLK